MCTPFARSADDYETVAKCRQAFEIGLSGHPLDDFRKVERWDVESPMAQTMWAQAQVAVRDGGMVRRFKGRTGTRFYGLGYYGVIPYEKLRDLCGALRLNDVDWQFDIDSRADGQYLWSTETLRAAYHEGVADRPAAAGAVSVAGAGGAWRWTVRHDAGIDVVNHWLP